MSKTTNNSKDIKEVTLYNFATIRNADYLNPEAQKKNISFIKYNEKNIQESPVIVNSIELKVDLDFLNFDKLKRTNLASTIKIERYNGEELQIITEYEDKTIQIRLNNFYDRIINLYNSRTDDFRKINQLLEGLDFENNLKVKLIDENAFIRKVWLSFVYNIKLRDNFKEKEIATNLLRYFHLRNHQYLIDDEKLTERWENLTKLMNAQIIIPEELFPKHETFFYGKKDIIKSKYKPSEDFKRIHFLKVMHLKSDIYDKQDGSTISALDASIDLQEENFDFLKRKSKKSFNLSTNFGNFSYLPYIGTIEFIGTKCYFLISIDYSEIDKKDFQVVDAYLDIKSRKFLFSKEPENSKLIGAGFDIYYELIDNKGNNILSIPNAKDERNVNFDFEVDFVSGNFKSLKAQFIWKRKFKRYQCSSCIVLDDGTDQYGKAFEPSGYGIQMLGIAEYRKVVSTISRYVPAEVAKIENLMSGEFREKVTTQETSTEITEFESTETEKETQNETSTNDRFQMQNEVAQILNEQRNNNLTASAGYSGGGYSANLTTGNTTATSKEQSNTQSITQAKEVTNKAVEKIVSKVKKERTVRVTEKFIDVNKYGFDNRGNKEHVSGVYRHINAVYRNRIQNYGKRLTYEFSIPEPALLHKIGTEVIEDDNLFEDLKKIPVPPNPADYITSSSDLNEDNYMALSKMFGVKDFKDFPKKTYKEFKHNFQLDSEHPTNFNLADSISVDFEGFIPVKYHVNSKHIRGAWGVQVGRDGAQRGWLEILIDNVSIYRFGGGLYAGNEDKSDIVYNADAKIIYGQKGLLLATSGNFVDDFNFEFEIEFIAPQIKITEWQKELYKLLIDTYDVKKNEYEKQVKKIIDDYKKQKLEQKKALIEAAKNNPKSAIRYRQIEIISLKRNCLSYLIDDIDKDNKNRKFGTNLILNRDFKYYKIELSSKLDEYTAFVRFLEQAFEWENMSYNFYPYFWGNRKKSWFVNYNEDNDDPLHKAFLQAGMARVIVTVRPGFEDAVNIYMTTGKIWLGGNVPVYGSSLFVSIADELKNGNEEYFIDGEWESVLPTNLIAIQSSGVAINQEGLPDLDEYGGLGIMDKNKNTPKRKKFLGLF